MQSEAFIPPEPMKHSPLFQNIFTKNHRPFFRKNFSLPAKISLYLACWFDSRSTSLGAAEERNYRSSGGATAGRDRAFALSEMHPLCLLCLPPWQSKR